MKGGVTKIYIFSKDGFKEMAATKAKIRFDSEEDQIKYTDFEVVESSLLSDQDTCSGHECFYKRTGVKCNRCKIQ